MMELPSQSGLYSPTSDPGTDSDCDVTMSRAQIRKSNKPLLEKKRRARINKSLEQLKSLVLDALKKDSARYSKLEKADILEMTVKHLRDVQRHQMAVAMTVDPSVVGRFQSGFSECAQEVNRYLGTIDGLSTEVRMRLMQHLAGCPPVNQQQQQQQQQQMAFPMSLYGVPSGSPPHHLPGVTLRASHLPYGGLGLSSSPESPTLPMSHGSPYTPPDNSPYQRLVTKIEPSRCQDNTENIAPTHRPLAEKTFNEKRKRSDRNNNDEEELCFKKPKLEAPPVGDIGIHGNVADKSNLNIFDMSIKMEPVWRPW